AFRQAATRLEQSAAAENNFLRQNAKGISAAQIDAASLDTKAAIQAARENYLTNVWRQAADAKVSLVADARSLVDTVPAAKRGAALPWVEGLESAADRYMNAQTLWGRKTAAEILEKRLGDFERTISNLRGVNADGTILPSLQRFESAADGLRAARYMASA